MKELISVIVPIYNIEKELVRCLDTLIKQSYNNLEIILINDGSTDGSQEICEKFAELDSRVKIFKQTNLGLSMARNLGIEKSTGRYLCFVDGDDYISSDMISFLYRSLMAYNADISSCAYSMIYADQEVEIKEGDTTRVLESKQAIELMFRKKNLGIIACNKLYKCELFDGIRYPCGKKFEDINTTYKLFDKANTIVYSPIVKYYYVQRLDSINGKSFNNNFFNYELYDMIRAVDEVNIFVQEKYKEIYQVVLVYSLSYYLRVINQLIIYNKKDNDLLFRIRNIILNNKKYIITTRNLSISKKLQLLIFIKPYKLYKTIVKFKWRWG